MITVSTKINRPNEVVWKYFTTTRNWRKWYGGGLKTVTPTWQEGAKLVWESGAPTPIEKFISGKEVCSSDRWIDTTFKFMPEGDSATIFTIIESDPKGGASFRDGGAANKANLEKYLQKFKEVVEKETNMSPDQGKNWWEFWK